MLLLRLLAPLPMLRAHRLHGLLNLRLLVRGQNAEDLVAQLTGSTANGLRAGRMRLCVLIEQTLNLIVLLVREVHAVEQTRPAPIDFGRSLRPGGRLLLHNRLIGSLLRAHGDGKR